MTRFSKYFIAGVLLLAAMLPAAAGAKEQPQTRSVQARVQTRPGGPVQDAQMKVHAVPVDLPSVSANAADLADEDLVLGVVLDGKPKAFPIRFLAMHEVIDDRVGETPVAPTW